MNAIHISEVTRADIGRINWHRVHIEADKRPPIKLHPNVGKWR